MENNSNDDDERLRKTTEAGLRDEIAMRAMQGLISGIDNTGGVVPIDDDHLSERAYEIADAMMAARKSKLT